ncbi:MAG: DEAD/DEAH box helicase [candidate division KSB1 bacterium]|nr:DEAD/DEAH box helicase [candidate division KSB1 bacterium]
MANNPALFSKAGVFFLQIPYTFSDIPARSGFKWHTQPCYAKDCPACKAGVENVWFTGDAFIANQFREWADRETTSLIDQTLHRTGVDRSLSRATDADIDIPAPEGLEYLPFQKAGIAYALNRSNALIADEMGMGKTIQAIGVINAINPERVLVVCPAMVKINWYKELRKWLVKPYSVDMAEGIFWPAFAKIVIINYDILHHHQEKLLSTPWDLVVIDEAHYLKNITSRRTKIMYGSKDHPPVRGKMNIAMTGTPIENRLKDIWPTLHYLDPASWQSFKEFMDTYHQKDYIPDPRAPAWSDRKVYRLGTEINLDQLQEKLRSTIMVRRLKADVLPELPPKFRQVIPFSPGGFLRLLQAENRAFEVYDRAKQKRLAAEQELNFRSEAIKQMRRSEFKAFQELSKARLEVAKAKLPYAIEHIEGIVESQPVVVFAYHREILKALYERFKPGGAGLVMGGIGDAERDAQVRAFQNGEFPVFVAQIANAEGYTVSRASIAVFVELEWRWGKVSQAEDRLHRIGQKGHVLIQHTIFEGSLDARMLASVIEKQEVSEKALDRQEV